MHDTSLKRTRSPSLPLTEQQRTKRPKLLCIQIPRSSTTDPEENATPSCSSLFSPDLNSLFDDIDDFSNDIGNSLSGSELLEDYVALRTTAPIPGLFFDPMAVIPQELEDSVMSFCMQSYFSSTSSNQVMLFGRLLPISVSPLKATSGLPEVLLDLLEHVSVVLKNILPPGTYDLLFPTMPTMARQAIINLYKPGEGISPHVDLLGRYADGIIGVSLGSGCVMRFDKVLRDDQEAEENTRWDMYLPERSIIVLSKEARYDWTHGIEEKTRDPVENPASEGESSSPRVVGASQRPWTRIERGVRLSVTFRWLLPGADVVGDDGCDDLT